MKDRIKRSSSVGPVRLPYARNPNLMKPTKRQLGLIRDLQEQTGSKLIVPDTKAEASDLIALLLRRKTVKR